ncbi:protein YgfX [Uliginosibacterium sediminicola]|uniref:Protein YgfX n=1 Tax=Uliginosibacterium sediminicola TaxID=2024550 RepID=A0ABU9YZN9_9RHOO
MIEAPRSIPLEWSPALKLATIFVHLLPLVCSVPESVPAWCRALVGLLCSISAIRCVLRLRRLRGAVLLPDESGALFMRGALRQRGLVLPGSHGMGPFLVLHWQPESGASAQHFVLMRDAFSAQAWRQLQVWLRWRIQTGAV